MTKLLTHLSEKNSSCIAFISFYLCLLFSLTSQAQISNIRFAPDAVTYQEVSGGTTLVAAGNIQLGNAALRMSDQMLCTRSKGLKSPIRQQE
jgi:hypothetical protein